MFSPCLTSPRPPKPPSERLLDPQELKLFLSLSLKEHENQSEN